MPRELFELELEELSLVDRPANQEAMVSLFKRENPLEEEKMEELQQEIETLKAEALQKGQEIELKDAEIERLAKALEAADFVVTAEAIEKKAPVEEIEVEGVKVNKADVPAVVLKALEKAAAERADVALTKRAETELPNFKLEVAKSLLLKVGDDTEALSVLKSADKLFAGMQEEVGKGENTTDNIDPEAKLEKMAKDYAVEKNVSYYKAYSIVCKTEAGKALANEIQKKD